MALKKRMRAKSGVEADYHKIKFVNVDITGQKLAIGVDVYLNETIRRDGVSTPISSPCIVIIKRSIIRTLIITVLKLAYPLLKQQELYKDAEDC